MQRGHTGGAFINIGSRDSDPVGPEPHSPPSFLGDAADAYPGDIKTQWLGDSRYVSIGEVAILYHRASYYELQRAT